jgi:competence protein ComEC
LGVKDDLDPEVRDAYAASGAMHVLAVSGLHVGIFYWLILVLAKPFQKGPASKWIIAIISLLVLWSYALVTGLSPSVMRAVTMFSFFSLARAWNQKTNVYNVVAASAFCLLLYNPHLIMSVGFQLSYMAVIGIVTLQPRLYRLWEPEKLVWDHVWKISTVAIAAQLATFPLGIFYFNQFPNYFLLSNIVVIPGAFMVLVGGILLLGVSFSSLVAGFFGEMLGWIIKAINAMIFGIESLPFSHVENIYIDSFQCILIIGIVAMIFLFFEYKNSFYLISTAAAVVTLSLSMWIHYSRVVARPTVTIYNIPGHTAIDFAEYGKVQFIADNELMGDVSSADYFIRPNRCRQGIQKALISDSLHREFEGCTIFAWQNRTILRIHSTAFRIPNELKVDYVIVSNDAVQNLGSVVDHLQTKEIILDSSNSFYRTKTMMAESENLSVPVYSVRHQGAFTIKI